MPYTFGGATGDDVSLPIVSTVSGPGIATLITCWLYPTTLTAGRAVCGFGNNISRVVLDATTSELDLLMDTNTTDGVWTSTGLGLAVDTWSFVAMLWTGVAGPTMDARLWAGDAVTPPAPVTFTQATAPTGTFSSQTTMTIGNGSGSAAIAWQGDIAQFDLLSTNIAASAIHPFGLAAYGAISAEAEDMVLDRYVRPLWEGRHPLLPKGAVVNNTTSMQHVSCDLTLLAPALRHIQTSSANDSIAEPTYNGVTPSERACPRPRFGHAVASHGSRVAARR